MKPPAAINSVLTAHRLFLSISSHSEYCALPLHWPVNACCSFTSSAQHLQHISIFTVSCLLKHNAQEGMTQAQHSREGALQRIEGEAAEEVRVHQVGWSTLGGIELLRLLFSILCSIILLIS